jgi:hypothetical protein
MRSMWLQHALHTIPASEKQIHFKFDMHFVVVLVMWHFLLKAVLILLLSNCNARTKEAWSNNSQNLCLISFHYRAGK